MTVQLTDNQRDIATCYVAQFAPRADAYSAFLGGQWVAVKEPLTPEVIAGAMRRTDPDPPVSCYFPDREGLTHVGALDLDLDNGLDLAWRIARRMAQEGATAYVEPSRRGAHVWWPLAQQLPAWRVRRAMRGALVMAGIPFDPKIELRPGMNGAPSQNGLGHALRMPMMRHPATGQSFPLHTPDGTQLPTKLADLLHALEEPTTEDVVRAIAKAAPVDPATIDENRRPIRSFTERQADRKSVSAVVLDRWGAMLKPGRANRCFMPAGHANGDKHPSLSVTADDDRLICKTPSCPLNNGDKGYSAWELERLDL